MITYCLRHGEAEHNLNQIMNGDPSKQFHLTKLGRQQIEEAALTVKDIPLEIIFTSEFPRAIETAEIINKYHQIPIIRDKRLNDLVSGVESQTYSFYKEQQRMAVKEQEIHPEKVRLNDGESLENELQRIYDFLDETRMRDYKHILISAHFDTVQIIKRYARGLQVEEDFVPQQGKIYRFKI